MSWDMRLEDWKKFLELQNTKNIQKAESMICDDCIHNTVCRLDGNEMLEWCSARVPSADVEKVVRCNDCKHANKERLPQGSKWFASCDHFNTHSVMADDYCSYAKRRESE